MKKALSLALALMMLISMVCVVPVLAATPDGSAQNPYQVTTPNSAPASVTIPAHGAVYYQYKASVFNGWSIQAYGLTSISVDGKIYDEMDLWNEILVTLKFTIASKGIVGYFNDTDEEVEVSLTHTEPVGSQSNPAELDKGDNALTLSTKGSLYYAVFVAQAAGEHTFSIANAATFEVIAYTNGDFKEGDANTLVNGTLTLDLERYETVYITLKATVSNAKATLTVDAPVSGTEENPLYLTAEDMDVTYDWSAGDMYFWVDGQLTGNILTITSVAGAEFTALVDGLDYVSEGGVMNVELDAGDWYIEVILTSEVDNEVAFAIEFAVGSAENPIELQDGDNEIAIPEGGYYYYTYTTQTEGLLILAPADASAFELLDVYYQDAKGDYHYAYLAEGATSALLSVPAGQLLTITAHGVFSDGAFETEAVNTVLNVAVKELLMYNTFEGADENGDLEGWTSSSDLVLEEVGEESNVANGLYSVEFTTAKSYANMYKYVNVEKNTNYEVTFKAMASEASTLWVKLNNNWEHDVAQADVKVGIEWAEYTMSVNSGDFTNLVLLFQHSGENVVTYWFDDIIITKGGETPVEILYGDANGDGAVNNRDVALLQQYINKWDVTLDLVAADANGDGAVNNRDVALLQQYINKWDVTLGPTK